MFGYHSENFGKREPSPRVHEKCPKNHVAKTCSLQEKCESKEFDVTSRAPKLSLIEPHEFEKRMRKKRKKKRF